MSATQSPTPQPLPNQLLERPASQAADATGAASLPPFTWREYWLASARVNRVRAESLRLEAQAFALEAELRRRGPNHRDNARALDAERNATHYRKLAGNYEASAARDEAEAGKS